jgi:hypothetical protein
MIKILRMPKQGLVKEHNELIRILKSGDKAGIRKEIREQSNELKEIKNK